MPARVAVISGASSGIGAATAEALAAAGYCLALGARREDKLATVAERCRQLGSPQVLALSLDVKARNSVELFTRQTLSQFPDADIALINNAGMARGTATLAEVLESDWQQMIDTNLSGLLRITRQFLPDMIARKKGHVVNIGSIAGKYVYEGGGVYCATKHAVLALTRTLKLELNGKGIRVSTIDPGMVETEFSHVRFGDEERAKQVYRGMKPLTAKDIAECVRWILTLPSHVNVDEVVLTPIDQASVSKVFRRS